MIVLRYSNDPNVVAPTARRELNDVLNTISEYNGSSIERVKEWLEQGLKVYTSFGYWIKE